MEEEKVAVQEEADAVVKAESIIKRYVKEREDQISGASSILAGFVTAAIAAYFSHYFGFTGLGAHSSIWSGATGFFVGVVIGERLAFTALGAALMYFYMLSQQWP